MKTHRTTLVDDKNLIPPVCIFFLQSIIGGKNSKHRRFRSKSKFCDVECLQTAKTINAKYIRSFYLFADKQLLNSRISLIFELV